jgi:hypothetical protein
MRSIGAGCKRIVIFFAENPRQSSFQPKLPFIEYSAAGVKIMFIIDCILGISPCVKGAG